MNDTPVPAKMLSMRRQVQDLKARNAARAELAQALLEQRAALRRSVVTVDFSYAQRTLIRTMLRDEIVATPSQDDLVPHSPMLFDAVLALITLGVSRDCALARNRRRAVTAVLDVAQDSAMSERLADLTSDSIADIAYVNLQKTRRLAA